jgi:hypothetical protein
MYNVLIASPQDIFIEQKIVGEICSGINEGILPNNLGISFKVTRWKDVFSSGISTQDIIKKLVDEYDIFVCIFQKKISIFSEKDASGSLDKFLSVYDSWKSLKKPHIMFFFKELKNPSIKDLEDPQLKKVLELKEHIKNDNLFICEEFSAPYEFCEKVHDYLDKWSRENQQAS